MNVKDYFIKLASCGEQLLDQAPIERESQPLEYALQRLAPHLEQAKPEQLRRLKGLHRPAVEAGTSFEIGVGLNSIGMLTDRFTILIIKGWCLANKGKRDKARARALYENQTMDIIEAISRARPGHSAMNSKITNIVSDASAVTWEEAFYGLFTTNLLIWESQEMLYVKDIGHAEYDELRSYIKWFSLSNIRRNGYIELCEKSYWAINESAS